MRATLNGGERRRIRHRDLAGEALADIDGRLAVDEALAREERDVL